MAVIDDLKILVDKFDKNYSYYKDKKNKYNEQSCRMEYIDPLLMLLGWDVTNKKGVSPQFREVIAEKYSSKKDRPDYTLTLRGVTKFFVEAKSPSEDVIMNADHANQTRSYGWNGMHKIAVLTNFEYLIIYDTTVMPNDTDASSVARYKVYHYLDYVSKFDEISAFISRNAVYSGSFDITFNNAFSGVGHITQSVDMHFLKQINEWRVELSNDLYSKAVPGSPYNSLEILNDVVQEFINQIVFLRICEDKKLPLYHSLKDNIKNKTVLHKEMEKMFREADKLYNSGMFSGPYIIFDLDNEIIKNMVEELYYPKSPYKFNIIEPNMLGKMYEMFLTEELIEENGVLSLSKRRDCKNRSVVTTPTEIVKYIVANTLERLCKGKTPQEIIGLRFADIACGSGIFLEELFEQLQNYCVEWYIKNDISHLEEIHGDRYKLPLEDKKNILVSCIYGIDIDVHAVEVAKFSLLIKLIENETAPSVSTSVKVLPNLDNNILHGNSLVDNASLAGKGVTANEMIQLVPFDWSTFGADNFFDAIVGNPPYVKTAEMHILLPEVEINDIYKNNYKTSYQQFDKYFIFIERALEKLKKGGYLCYIVPNKFFKIKAGKELRRLISYQKYLVSLDDFGDAQLFEDKTIYSSILLLRKEKQEYFDYSSVENQSQLWAGTLKRTITKNNR